MITKDIENLFKQSIIYIIITTLGQVVGFIMLPIYTRYLTPKDYGILSLLQISTFLLGMVLTTGISATISRFYYDFEKKEEKNKILSTMYITYCFFSVCIMPFFFLLSPTLSTKIFDSSMYIKYINISIVTFILGGLLDIGFTYLRIIDKVVFYSILSICRLIILLSLNVFFIVYKDLKILGILYSALLTNIFFQFILTIPILIVIKPRFSFRYSMDMLKFSTPLIPARLANTFIKQSDSYFIRYLLSITDTGIYALANKFGTAIHLFITSAFQLGFEPKRFEISKSPEAKQTYNKIFIYHLMILIFLGLGISIFVPEVLKLMVTSDYYRAGPLIPLIVFSMILLGARNHFEIGILWSKRTKHFAYINGIVAVLNLIFNFVFIKAFGLWGAIYSSIIIIVIHNILIYRIGKKYYPIKFDFTRIAKSFAVAFLIYGLSLIIKTDYIAINIILKSFLLCTFLVTLFWLKIAPDELIIKIRSLRQSCLKQLILVLNSRGTSTKK